MWKHSNIDPPRKYWLVDGQICTGLKPHFVMKKYIGSWNESFRIPIISTMREGLFVKCITWPLFIVYWAKFWQSTYNYILNDTKCIISLWAEAGYNSLITHSRPHSFLQRSRARSAHECRMWEYTLKNICLIIWWNYCTVILKKHICFAIVCNCILGCKQVDIDYKYTGLPLITSIIVREASNIFVQSSDRVPVG